MLKTVECAIRVGVLAAVSFLRDSIQLRVEDHCDFLKKRKVRV